MLADRFSGPEVVHHGVQAGAITGFVSAFAEGPIDFFKSQIQVQIIRSKSDPNYKRRAPLSACRSYSLPPGRRQR